MSLTLEELRRIITNILLEGTLLLALLRWVLSWAPQLIRNRITLCTSRSPCSSAPPPPLPFVTSHMIRDNLVLATYGDITKRLPKSSDTCVVCLSPLVELDQVRELRNCCHVFHRECIDKWLDYDRQDYYDGNHKSCPLCRAPLWAFSQGSNWAGSGPKWRMKRLVHLFGNHR